MDGHPAVRRPIVDGQHYGLLVCKGHCALQASFKGAPRQYL